MVDPPKAAAFFGKNGAKNSVFVFPNSVFSVSWW
jgi:hypothetical protein